MHEDTFDQLIQHKLGRYEVPASANDWDLLAKQLEEVATPVKGDGAKPVFQEAGMAGVSGEDTFDEFIREKLTQFQVIEGAAASWEVLSQRMFGAFETSVGEKLAEYEVPYDPANWEDMVAYLDKPFFKVVKEKLLAHSIPYQVQDWKQMRQALQAAEPVLAPLQREWVNWRIYAVAASLAFIFMLLPLWRSASLNPIEQVNTEVADTQDEPTGPPVQPLLPGKSDMSKGEETSPEGEDGLVSQQNSVAEKGTPGSGIQLEAAPPESREGLTPILPDPRPIDGLVEASISPEGLPVVEHANADIDIAQFEHQYEATVEQHKPGIQVLPVKNGKKSILGEPSVLGLEHAIEWVDNRKKIHPEFLLGFYSGSTSSSAELNDKGQLGIVGGMRVEMKFTDQLSVVSGIQYAQKGFSHTFTISETLDNASGRRRVSQVLEADFSTIELPALVRFRVPSEEKHTLYIQSGIVSFFMLDETYRRFDPVSAQNTEIISTPADVFADPTETLNHTNHKLSFTTYVANIHAALGWEYKLSDDLLLQLEPYFQMGLQKMGPPGASSGEKKNLYTGGIGAGIIYDLSGFKKRKGKTKIF